MNNKEITFITFFDENTYENFLLLRKSINSVYPNSKIIVGTCEKNILKLKKIKNQDLIIVDIAKENLLLDNKIKNPCDWTTNYTYYRIFSINISKKFGKEESTLIYLDTDTLVLNPIPFEYLKSSDNFSFAEKIYGKEHREKWIFTKMNLILENIRNESEEVKIETLETIKRIKLLWKDLNYFNAGFLIINDQKKFQLFEKEFNRILNNGGKIFIDDQTFLNDINFKLKIFNVIDDQRLNFQTSWIKRQPDQKIGLYEMSEKSVIHFTYGEKLTEQKKILKFKFNI